MMPSTRSENSAIGICMTEGEKIRSALDILNLRCPEDIQLEKGARNSDLQIKRSGW